MKNLERKNYYKKSGIYRIYSIKNNKSYIGSTSNLYGRINLHIKDLEYNKHHSIHLQRHYNKYGKDDLVIEILCFCEKDKLYKLELENILIYDSYENGFNCLQIPGSFLGYKFTEEQLNKLKKIQKENSVKYRKSLLERLEKARKSKKDNPVITDWWIGKKHTLETKKKMSLSAKKRGFNNGKKIVQRDMNDNFISTYESAYEAQRITGIQATNIGKCCLGERRSAGKFKWEFIS